MPRSFTCVPQVEAREHPIQSFVRCQAGIPLDRRPRILLKGYDTDVQIEPAGPNQSERQVERGAGPSAFDAGDGRLRDPDTAGQRLLRQPRALPSLANQLSRIHTFTIPLTYRYYSCYA